MATHPDATGDRGTGDRDGARVGVELELGGLGEDAAARIVQAVLGGEITAGEPFECAVTGTRLGRIRIELDTSFRAELAGAPDFVARAARVLVPLEIITDPVPRGQIALLDPLCAALRDAGAEGTGAHLLNGFGVHFNPEVLRRTIDGILPVMQAHALLEPWMRSRAGTQDLTRRILPFTDPWPEKLVRALLSADPGQFDLAGLIDLYLDLAPSRNFGLDMLPLFASIDPDRVVARLGEAAPKPRPTYHYRLPPSRVDEPGWGISTEWRKWQLVEAVAADADLLAQLSVLWLGVHDRLLGGDAAWSDRLDAVLTGAAPGAGAAGA